MTGTIKTIIELKHYGFIRSGNKEYFFHHDNILDNWDALVTAFRSSGKPVNVEFQESTAQGKGPRAEGVRMI
jgi:cold shock CspA family protein